MEREIPLQRGHFLLGSIKEVKRDFLGFMSNLFARYGAVAKFYLGRKPVYLISEPSLIEQVMVKRKDIFVKAYEADRPRGLALILGQGLVTSKGALWQRQRRMIQPIFHRSNLLTMGETITSTGTRMIDAMLQQGAERELEMGAWMSEATLEIIARTMFSSGAEKLQHRLAPDLELLLDYAQSNFFHPVPIPLFIPTRKNRRFMQSKRFLTRAIVEMVDERRASGQQQDDLLDVLLKARDEASGEGMSTQQIVDESLTIFSAGHETTATALTWALYLLATHPVERTLLLREIDTVLQGRVPTVADMDALPYTRAVLDETLRLYPSIVLLLRRVEQDVVLNGYHFEQGAHTLVNLYNLHHHPDYWPAPDEFRPQRFLAADKEAVQRHSYLPFGIGQRVCIGNHFAMMEAVLLLAQLMQRLELELIGPPVAEPRLAVSLRPKGGLRMRVRARAPGREAGVARRA